MRFSRQRTLSLRSEASYSGMFLHKILAGTKYTIQKYLAILLLQVVRAFYIPVDSAEPADSTTDDSASSESTFEITEVALTSDSNEMTDTTNVQDLILDQVLIPLMDIKRVQNLLFLVSIPRLTMYHIDERRQKSDLPPDEVFHEDDFHVPSDDISSDQFAELGQLIDHSRN
ncbi:hypothetical protein TSAR_006958 [Trichomalopsis sarcophagae]|uniref:Uncharacterized protein n=1 Tax=Trichomalopsis sarcophagae TaxID=543379 RepID=A0A232FH63_9HYME|nr:hypothetical protein TSAR_006958 [Trichomalopsis sarcophagae]